MEQLRAEFTDNGNWPHQIYVREARRMIGKVVMTENELTKRKETPDPVGMGSYTIDSHNVQRYITPEGYVQNEGDIGVGISPYTIAYGSLVPKKSQCENLTVSICVSSSHIALGSIRMEPVFMILGQSAATGAVMALDGDLAVQDVPYNRLRERLLKDGQVLEYDAPKRAEARVPKTSYLNPRHRRGPMAAEMNRVNTSRTTPARIETINEPLGVSPSCWNVSRIDRAKWRKPRRTPLMEKDDASEAQESRDRGK